MLTHWLVIYCPVMPLADIKTKPRWERRKDARPQELLAAALDLFVERGYAATRLDDVATRAGVSKGTLYLYFENKEELFKEVVRANLVSALAEAEEYVIHYTGKSRDLLRGFILRWWEHVGETKLSGISKLMMAESGNFPDVARFYHEEVIQRSNALIISMLERGIARGEFRSIDKVNANLVIVAPVLMLMMWKHSLGPCTADSQFQPDVFLRHHVDTLMHGWLAP